MGRVLLIASVIALISAIALLLCQAAEMTGSSSAAIDLTAVGAVLLDTRFGRVWRWRLGLTAMLVLVCLYRQPRRPVVVVLSLGLLASLGWVGHAAMDEGAARIGHELNQTAHLLAAGYGSARWRRWLGFSGRRGACRPRFLSSVPYCGIFRIWDTRPSRSSR